MKKILKYFFLTILTLLLIVLLAIASLYIPGVQRFVKNKAENYISTRNNVTFRIERFALKFPLNIEIDNIYMGKTEQDTMIYARNITMALGAGKILKRQVVNNNIYVTEAKVNILNDTTGLQLNINAQKIGLTADIVDLIGKTIDVDTINLQKANVFLQTGTSVNDTTESKPFNWLISVNRIKINDVAYDMQSESLPMLHADIRSGEITNGTVNIQGQNIRVDSVSIFDGQCNLLLSSQDDNGDNSPQTARDTTGQWTITANTVLLENYIYTMDYESGDGFELALNNIGVRIDDAYNRGTEVRANIQLHVVRPAGGQIDSLRADVSLESDRSVASNVYIQTPSSILRLDAVSEAPITDIISSAPISVDINGLVSSRDLQIVWADMPEELRGKNISINAGIDYSNDLVNIRNLQLSLPGDLTLQGNGRLTSFSDFNRLSGNLQLSGNILNPDLVNTFINDTLLRGPVQFTLTTTASDGRLNPNITLCSGEGCVNVTGMYSLPYQNYDLTLVANQFQVGQLLGIDSLGSVTADIRATGTGFDLATSEIHLTAQIDSVEYKRHPYSNILIAANLVNGNMEADIQSNDPDLILQLTATADSLSSNFHIVVNGEVTRADLMNLHFSQTPFIASLNLQLEARGDTQENYSLNGAIREVQVNNGTNTVTTGGLTLSLLSDSLSTKLNVGGGDFTLQLLADTGIIRLAQQFSVIGQTIQQQIDSQSFNMQTIQQELPPFTLDINGGAYNVINRFLRMQGITFSGFHLHASSSEEEQFILDADISNPIIRQIEFDSVMIDIAQQQTDLNYAIRLVNPVGVVQNIQDISLSGTLHENQLSAVFRQDNYLGQTEIDFGSIISLQDSNIILSVYPLEPVLGVNSWTANEGNSITYNRETKDITANLDLAWEDKLVSIQSQPSAEGTEALHIILKGINLGSVTGFSPFLPDLTGTLNTDLTLQFLNQNIIADGSVNVEELYYDGRRIGNVNLLAGYNTSGQNAEPVINLTLQIDGQAAITAEGQLASQGQDDMNINVTIPGLPLRILNPFLPPDVVSMEGTLNGQLTMQGNFSAPQIDGTITFQEASVQVLALGTSYQLPAAPIAVQNSRIDFTNFGLTSPNQQQLTITGYIILSPFADMRTQLTAQATNFQLVNVSANTTSLVYGRAFSDIDITVAGPFNNLDIQGDVRVLGTTNLNYAIREAAAQLTDLSAELVRFISFTDTLGLPPLEIPATTSGSGINIKLFVDIANDVSLNVDLDADEDNEIEVTGGGNLTLTMTPEGGTTLVGRYVLNTGTVRYDVPVVGEKNFIIEQGSYAEWTGPIDNPTLQIAASESLRVSVTDDNQSSRVVNFNAIIRIQNDLNSPEIVFDLDAPNDQVIQSQIATFTQEERTRQALNILIYNTYSGPGAIDGGSYTGNALNNFVEKELNQWSRRLLKSSNLSFGVDSYNQLGEGGQDIKRTDYSYEYNQQFFDDRINVKIGGRISQDNDPSSNVQDNLVDDIAIEYFFSKNRNWLLKFFRHTNYESVLEGEVTQTGGGIVWRKNFNKLKDLFIRRKKREQRAAEQQTQDEATDETDTAVNFINANTH